MIATVCELPNRPAALAELWPDLCRHVAEARSDFVLLPEMPFSEWLAGVRDLRPEAWTAAADEHLAWMERLGELGAETVVATRPVVERGRRLNRGFIWQSATDLLDLHAKTYLPNEPGFWEATWYDRGPTRFEVARIEASGEAVRAGFAICTELWFGHIAREYARSGVELALTPRATYAGSTEKWIAGGRAFAVAAGAWSLSSNFSGPAEEGTWGGTGWIVEPEEGEVVARTSPSAPFISCPIDLDIARNAKETYPRYVDDSAVE